MTINMNSHRFRYIEHVRSCATQAVRKLQPTATCMLCKEMNVRDYLPVCVVRILRYVLQLDSYK